MATWIICVICVIYAISAILTLINAVTFGWEWKWYVLIIIPFVNTIVAMPILATIFYGFFR